VGILGNELSKIAPAWSHNRVRGLVGGAGGMGQFKKTFPPGLKPNVDIVGLNVRAEARTLHLKPVPFKLIHYQVLRSFARFNPNRIA